MRFRGRACVHVCMRAYVSVLKSYYGSNVKVHASEVEEVLLSHPEVVEAAVVAVPDVRLGSFHVLNVSACLCLCAYLSLAVSAVVAVYLALALAVVVAAVAAACLVVALVVLVAARCAPRGFSCP